MTESSSYEETDQSKQPKDVLELGRYLVHELGFEGRFDTLGRWMAHHLAELIERAENSTTDDERSKARENAAETIFRLWEHRNSLPGTAYPLASFTNVLIVLDRLRPDKNPFRGFRHRTGTKLDLLTSDLFDTHSRLVLALLFIKLTATEKGSASNIDPIAIEALNETEQQVLSTLTQWLQLFESKSEIYVQLQNEQEEELEHQASFEQITLELIDDLMNKLQDIRSEIEGNR